MEMLDVDIQHYDFDELLNIFKIDEFSSSTDYQLKLTQKTDIIVDKYPEHIAAFFLLSKNVILAIFSLLENNIILQSQSDEYFEKIKKVPNLNMYSNTELTNMLIDQNDLNNLNKKPQKILNEPNVLNTSLNKEYDLNVGGRVDPSIDFKNNTNEIYNTYQNGVAPGSLNAIKRITQMMNINLNSCFRKNYFQSNPLTFYTRFLTKLKKLFPCVWSH
jgi:hypothetical protein